MKKIAVVNENRCVACGACCKACRRDAIQIFRGCFAAVEPGACVGCGLCARTCPADCIQVKERDGSHA